MVTRPLLALGAAIAALVLIIGDLEARPSGGSSFGSRGSRTYTAPPTTKTAPNTASPLERSATQPTRPGSVAAAPSQQTGGFFNRPGMMGGLLGGLLGAGLIGMLLGHGFGGGLAGFASVLGLIVQIGLIAGAAWLIWSWWQRRQAPATAMASAPAARTGTPNIPNIHAYNGHGTNAVNGNGAYAAASSFDGKVRIGNSDYDAFERLLGEVSMAYGAEDRARLGAVVTPEMLGYFTEQLAENSNRGVVNQISEIKLLQGDLAEAWREDDSEYATVAMRYAITEKALDRASGKVVEGSDTPQEVIELWTFLRKNGSGWTLSAIQQAQ